MTVTATPLYNTIIDTLADIGVPANLRGHQYLADSIEQVCLANSRLSMTKDVYTYVAAKRNTTARSAERCIRHAVELAFLNGDAGVIYSIFKNSVSAERGKATNGNFIYKVADTVCRKLCAVKQGV